MNVLLLDQFSDVGGAQRCLLDLLPAMQVRGWRTVVAAPGEGDLFRRAQAAGAIVKHVSCGPYSMGTKTAGDILRFARQQPRLKRQILDLMEEYRIGLLYVNGPRMTPAAVWAGRRVPVVFHCHSHVPKPYATWLVARPLASIGASCHLLIAIYGRVDRFGKRCHLQRCRRLRPTQGTGIRRLSDWCRRPHCSAERTGAISASCAHTAPMRSELPLRD